MTALFDYYEFAHPDEGVGSGFNYETVPHITLKSIANNEPPATETLYDKPIIDKSKHRVTGPFTMEAVPSPAVRSIDEVELGAGKEVGKRYIQLYVQAKHSGNQNGEKNCYELVLEERINKL